MDKKYAATTLGEEIFPTLLRIYVLAEALQSMKMLSEQRLEEPEVVLSFSDLGFDASNSHNYNILSKMERANLITLGTNELSIRITDLGCMSAEILGLLIKYGPSMTVVDIVEAWNVNSDEKIDFLEAESWIISMVNAGLL